MHRVKVTTITYLEIDKPTEEEAIEEACRIAWEYDADDIEAEIEKENEE